jgi:TonB family protein
MKTKKYSRALIPLKLLVALFFIAAILIAFSSCGRTKKWEATLNKILPPPLPPKPPTMLGSDTIWQLINEIPMFPGGDELLVKYISKHVQYPDAAIKNGTQGQVVVKFFISSKGKISGYEIFKSISPELDSEALRVVKTMTNFEPAIKNGKPVAAWYYLPITFKLQ